MESKKKKIKLLFHEWNENWIWIEFLYEKLNERNIKHVIAFEIKDAAQICIIFNNYSNAPM